MELNEVVAMKLKSMATDTPIDTPRYHASRMIVVDGSPEEEDLSDEYEEGKVE